MSSMPIPKKTWDGIPIIGKGLLVLLVNDDPDLAYRIFTGVVSGPDFKFAANAEKAIALIQKSKRQRKPFNAVSIDKNLEWSHGESVQKVIDKIQKISPGTHISIHSAETGPGKFTKYYFISLVEEPKKCMEKIRAFFRAVEKKPFLGKPVPISLHYIQRPVAIFKPRSGTVEVVHVIEGQALPVRARMLLEERGARIMSIPEAILLGPDRFAKQTQFDMLVRERERCAKIGLRVQRHITPRGKLHKPVIGRRK